MGLPMKDIVVKKRKDAESIFIHTVSYDDGKLKIVFTVLQYYYVKKNKKKSTDNLDRNLDSCRTGNGWLYDYSVFPIDVKSIGSILSDEQTNKG